MKEIKLTRGYVALVDDEDYEDLIRFKWYAKPGKGIIYAIRAPGYRKGEINKMIAMHREIMQTPDNMEVDHIDHNGLNNQKANLRNCYHGFNCKNRSRNKNMDCYIGVLKRGPDKFYAHIRYNYKRIHLGVFKNPVDAAIARDKAAKKYFGEFANLNFK